MRRPGLIVGLLVATLWRAAPAQAWDADLWFDEALRHDDQGDARQAFTAYLKAAEAGHPQAEFNVGVMLDSGRGTGRDVARAAVWYAKAAARRNRRAAYNLGQLYETGQGVVQNTALARAWFSASGLGAARGHLAMLQSQASDAGSLTAPIPLEPAGLLRSDAAQNGIELVWTSQPQPEPVQFYVELHRIDGADSREIVAQFLDVTSLLATPDHPAGDYAWRVIAVARRSGRYVASPWQGFHVSED